jgi:hypothetical protein
MHRTLLALGLLLPWTALAEPVLDARLDGSTTSTDTGRLGAGLGARLGYRFDVGPVELVPELGATFWMGDGLVTPDLGARVRFGSGIQPGLYAHLLLPLPTPTGPTRGWDAGASVDATFLPIDVGLHAGLLTLGGRDATPRAGLQLGVHVGVSF